MPTGNRLIEKLARRDRQNLLAIGESVSMTLSETLYEKGTKTAHVYFPIDGFVSLLTSVDESALEVGMVGREGMLGVHVLLGIDRSPLKALVQGSGHALRLPTRLFSKEIDRSPTLRAGLGRYLAILMSQLASSAACVRFHRIGPRLARWLLMSHDRARSDQFFVTQEFLASMLGVRRVGVTSAASALQLHGLIEYKRGTMSVLDRTGLEAAACSCYASDRAVYAEIMR